MSDTDLSRGSEASREIDFANWRLAMHIKKKKFKASSYTLIQKSNFVQKYIYTESFYGDLLPTYLQIRVSWILQIFKIQSGKIYFLYKNWTFHIVCLLFLFWNL